MTEHVVIDRPPTALDEDRTIPRVGLIVPRSNTGCEADLTRLCAGAATIHATRMRYSAGVNPEDPDAFFGAALQDPVADLSMCDVDLMVLGCTTVSMSCSQPVLTSTLQAGTTKRSLLVSEAVVDALRHVGAERIAVFTPYTRASNERIAAFLSARGFDVTEMRGLGLNTSPDRFRPVSRLRPDYLLPLVREMRATKADSLFLSCADMPTLDLIAPLEAEFGRPVLSTNQALVWRMMSMLGATAPAAPGRLFRTSTP